MGKKIRNKRKHIRKNSNIVQKKMLPTFTIDELLEKAQEQINTFNYEEAQTFCQEALKRDADNLKALETSANLCIETGNFDGAKHCLGRAITLVPENGFSKYLSMGQLLDGKDSLPCYLKGIELIQVALKKNTEEEKFKPQNTELVNGQNGDCNGKVETNSDLVNGESPVTNGNKAEDPEPPIQDLSNSLKRKLSNAYCAIAELYMSDLCDEEEAEGESLANIQKAIESDTTNPEAYQHMANFLLIKQNHEDAKTNIKKSVSLWLPNYLEVDSGEASAGSFDPVQVCPLTESVRGVAARILIEVEEHQLAHDVLEGLLGENDEAVYIWYLLGWNLYLQGGDHKADAKHHFLRAMELNESSPISDESILDHMKELLEDLKEVQVDAEDTLTEQEFEEQIENMDES